MRFDTSACPCINQTQRRSSCMIRPCSVGQARLTSPSFKGQPEMFSGHHLWSVRQGENELDAIRHHHPRTAVPASVVHHQDQQTNVCWIKPHFEQRQGGTEGLHVHCTEAQQIAASRVRMDEAIDVRPLEAVVVQGGRPCPPLGPTATEHAFWCPAALLGQNGRRTRRLPALS